MDAPAPYNTAAMCNLASGGLNAFFGFMFLFVCTGIVGLPIGIWQIMVGLKMKEGEKHPQAKNSLIAGIVGGLFTFDLLAIGIAAFGMMQLGQDEVVGWLEG